MSENPPSSPAGQTPRPLIGLFKHARTVLRVYVGVQAVFAAHLIVMGVIFIRAADGRYITPDLAEGLDLIGLGVAIAYFVALIWSIVLVLRFTFRSMKNLRLRGEETQMSPTMAVVWYFIPFALFYFPFKGMQEIWRRSHARVGQTGKSAAHLGAWWLTWIAGGLLGNITLRLVGLGEDASLEMLALTNSIDALGSLIHIASALLLTRIMGEVAQAQHQDIN